MFITYQSSLVHTQQNIVFIYFYLLLKCLLTSLNGAFFSLCAGEGVDELSKGAVAAEELLVGAALCDFSIYQHENMVSLWQEAHPMGHQDAGLCSKPHKSEK